MKQQLKQSLRRQLRMKVILGVGTLFILAGLLGVFSVYQVNAGADLHTSPVCTGCTGVYNLYELAWGTGPGERNWTAGSLSQTYNNVDGSETTFTITYSGATSKLGSIGTGATPNVQTFFPGGTKNALSNYVYTGFSGTETIVITIDISPAIPAQIGFDLYHINGSSYSGDKVWIHAEPEAGGAVIYPQFTASASASWEEEGNGAIDAIGSSTSGTRAYAGVNFSSPTLVNRLVITWGTCDLCGGGEHGIGIGNMEFYGTDSPLPVEWLDFEAEWQGQGAQLRWQTAQEINADYFEVERSIHGGSYEVLGRLPARGNTATVSMYEFNDPELPLPVSAVTYRLRQVDLNGGHSYSPLVELQPTPTAEAVLEVFPNTATDRAWIRIHGGKDRAGTLRAFSPDGKVFYERQMTNQTECQLPLHDWPAGVYHLQVQYPDQRLVQRLVVRH
jgi:hypothetical protein